MRLFVSARGHEQVAQIEAIWLLMPLPDQHAGKDHEGARAEDDDDAQVVDLRCRKWYAATGTLARVDVSVGPWEGDDV